MQDYLEELLDQPLLLDGAEIDIDDGLDECADL